MAHERVKRDEAGHLPELRYNVAQYIFYDSYYDYIVDCQCLS